MQILKGTLWTADLGQGIPETAVVLQSTLWNRQLPTTLVCPIQSEPHADARFALDPLHVCLLLDTHTVWARLDRLQPLARNHLQKDIGKLSSYSISAIQAGLQRHLEMHPRGIFWAVLGPTESRIQPVILCRAPTAFRETALVVPLQISTGQPLPGTRFPVSLLGMDMMACGDQLQAVPGSSVKGRVAWFLARNEMERCLCRVLDCSPWS